MNSGSDSATAKCVHKPSRSRSAGYGGASPRKSILGRDDYKTAGLPWDVRGAFVEGLDFAVIGEIPVENARDFTIYSGDNFLAKTLEGVWIGQTSIDEAMEKIQEKWQADLDIG